MKRKLIILILVIIVIYLILNYILHQNKIKLKDLLIFGLWQEMEIVDKLDNSNIYVIDTKNNKSIKVNISNTIKGEKKMYKKIAPGTKGEFIIRLKKDEDIKCKIIITDITKKPINLEFYFNGNIYSSLKEIQKDLNSMINEKNEIQIDWNWKYDTNEEDDIQDTKDGQSAEEYVFRLDTYVED